PAPSGSQIEREMSSGKTEIARIRLIEAVDRSSGLTAANNRSTLRVSRCGDSAQACATVGTATARFRGALVKAGSSSLAGKALFPGEAAPKPTAETTAENSTLLADRQRRSAGVRRF